MDLFSDEKRIIKLPNATLLYIKNFYDMEIANRYFSILKDTIQWQQDDISIFGKTYQQPRLTALYGDNDKPYSYSGITMHPEQWTSELLEIKNDIESEIQHRFTSVLLNFYRDGNDSNSWHADNEKELAKNPIIASVSFGETRTFHFKHRHLKEERHKIDLHHGSLLVMKDEMQHFWLHHLAKTKKTVGERINLTYRRIV